MSDLDITDTLRSTNRRLGVLISGRGSNLQAIIDAIGEGRLDATIAIVISNREDAKGLQRAKDAGIETLILSHRGYPDRAEYDRLLVEELRKRNVRLVCLAGFMRLLGPTFINAFPNAVLNIHPSLLPAFPGVDAQKQAWEHGAQVTGATVHFVTAALDADTLAARILIAEHRLYPDAIQRVLNGHWHLAGRRVVSNS
jgi:phosphoribosylglycinamide formyltransferase-1